MREEVTAGGGRISCFQLLYAVLLLVPPKRYQ
jgi:hypothetical protein